MDMFKSRYDPVGTKTYAFFGNPPPTARLSPVKSFFSDIGNVFTHVRLLPLMLALFPTDRPIDELYLRGPSALSLIWFTLWSIVQVPFVVTILVFYLGTAALLNAITSVLDLFIWRPIQGPQLQVYPPCPPPAHNPRHRWIYINGVAAGKTITQQNLQLLSETFQNPVLAINNRTYGVMGDLVECISQRALGYRSKETGIAYDIMKRYLKDNINVDKVILVAHSQGGIIASQILDDLYCALPRDELAKLEVYTFGSAALSCNNPWTDKSRTSRVVPVMEHYCNERDMVTSWGALSSADRHEIPFKGKVFVFKGQTGHMLNQHYLRHMFTGPEGRWDHTAFQLRAVRRDRKLKDYYHVGGEKASKGQESVRSLSNLWKYM